MTATEHKTLIELASEGLDYREHDSEREFPDLRRVLDQAKAMAEAPTTYWSDTGRPALQEITPAMVAQVRAQKGEEMLVAVMPSNEQAYRERCRWLKHSLIVRTQKTERGHCVFARSPRS